MGKGSFEIAFELLAKMDPSVKKSFQKASKEVSNFGKGISNAAKTTAKVAAGIGASILGIGTAAFAMTNSVVSDFDKIAKHSRKLGIASDTYQEMEYWASQNGISSNDMEKAVGRLNQRIGMAAQGNENYSSALSSLGVDMEKVRDGTLSTEDAMAQSIQSLSKIENEQKKAAMASELFGVKLGRELMPALQDGSLSIEDAKKKAEELGVVIEGDSLSAAESFADSWDDITRSFKAFGQNIAAELMPKFQQIMDWVLVNMPAIKSTISSAMSKAGDIIGSALEKAKPIFEWVKNTGAPMASEAIRTMVDIGQSLFDKAQKIYNFISTNWSTIKPVLTGIAIALASVKIAMVAMSIVQVVTGFMTAFKGATLAAKLSMLGLNGAMLANPMTWVVAAIVALIAAGVLLVKNWDTVKQFFIDAWNSIKSAVAPVGAAISGAFQTAYDAVTSLFGGIADWFSGIWQGVTGVLTGAINGLISTANGAIGKLNGISVDIPEWVPKFGGKSFGLSIPKIPMLAEGGIATGPTLAMIGEGAETEAVLPLSKLKSFIDTDGKGTNITSNREDKKVHITYSPQYVVESGASKEDIESVSRRGYEEFKRFMDKYNDDKKRVEF